METVERPPTHNRSTENDDICLFRFFHIYSVFANQQNSRVLWQIKKANFCAEDYFLCAEIATDKPNLMVKFEKKKYNK